MNKLSSFGVSAQLSKLEFIDIASAHTFNVLGVALYRELLALDAVREYLKGIPLVSKRDYALRSSSI